MVSVSSPSSSCRRPASALRPPSAGGTERPRDTNFASYIHNPRTSANDTLLRKFIYGPGIDEPICLIDVADANALYYYHRDGLGSVVALCDVNSAPVERYAYDVFGRPTIRNAGGTVIAETAFGNPYLFTGRAYDAESGLYYYRARYYDYATGRFLQPDPIGYSGSLNLYQYCQNNPAILVDPFGLREYCTITTSYGGGAWIVSGEAGLLFVIDPQSLEVYAYKYGALGVGLGAGGGMTVQVGTLDMDDPLDITGWGLEVSAFAAMGTGASGQVAGTGPFGNGSMGVAGGPVGGWGAGVSGMVTRTKYIGKRNLQDLPPDIRAQVAPYLSDIKK